MAIFEGNNPLIVYDFRKGSPDDPFPHRIEGHQIINGRVKLPEIPVWEKRVDIKDETGNQLIEIQTGSPEINQYRVDYNLGIIFFNPARNNEQVIIDYYGKGIMYLNTSLLWTQLDLENKTVIETLEDILVKGREGIEALEQVDDALNEIDILIANTNYHEPYNPSTTYKQNNIISFNGSSYIAKKETKGNPPTENQDNEYWGLLSRKGADGTGTVATHQDTFIATEGQRVFNLSHPYDQFKDRTWVYVGGVPQKYPDNYEETTSTSITLSEGVPAGTEVIVKYFGESVPLESDIQTTVDNHTIEISNHATRLFNAETNIQQNASNFETFKTFQTTINSQNSNKFSQIESQLAQIETNKAEISYVDMKTQANNLSFKESFETLTDLQNEYPNGDTYNHVVLENGMIYTWVNGTWINTHIQANGTGIADNTISPKKTTFIKEKTGKNILDETQMQRGMIYSDGVFVPDDTSAYIFIPLNNIEPNRKIILATYVIADGRYQPKKFHRVYKYTEDGAYVGYDDTGWVSEYIIPNNINKVILRSAADSFNFEDYHYAVEYDELTTYEPYYTYFEMSKTVKIPSVPTKTSELENDSGFITVQDLPNESTNYINCWGDSLTDGSGASSTVNRFPSVLNTLVGENYSVRNLGIAGEGARSIAMRQGGIPLYVNPFTIPADTTSVLCTFSNDLALGYSVSLLRRAGTTVDPNYPHLGINPVTIAGVKGTLSRPDVSKNEYYFTRLEAGSEVVLNRPTALFTYAEENYRKDIAIIWVGTNDTSWTVDQIIDVQQYMVDNLKHDKFIIVGLTSKSYHPNVADKNEIMRKRWGKKFLDIRTYILNYGLEDAGITPTTEDNNAIDNGEIPPSLLNDTVHFNDFGYSIIANQIYQKGKDLSYW